MGEVLKKILKPSSGESADKCEQLPSKKKLQKRMKRLAASFFGKGDTPDGDGKEDSAKEKSGDNMPEDSNNNNCGFHVIDQTDHDNILLSVMLKGQLSLKPAAKVNTVKAYTELVTNEINARIQDLVKSSDENDTLIQEWKKMKDDINILYLNNIKKSARASKNILRAMVSFVNCVMTW